MLPTAVGGNTGRWKEACDGRSWPIRGVQRAVMYAISHSTLGVTVAGSSPAHRMNDSSEWIEEVIASADEGGIDAVIVRAVRMNGRTHSGTELMSYLVLSIVGTSVRTPAVVFTVTDGRFVRGLGWTVGGIGVVVVAVEKVVVR